MSKLVQVAKRIIKVLKEEQFELKMGYFVGDESALERNNPIHECGTSLCIAGALAHLDGYPEEYECPNGTFKHVDYSYNLLGLPLWNFSGNEEDNIWSYFFGSPWPDDKEQAIKRMKYVIEHGHIMPVDDWPEHGWKE